jgi:hypothetical protein
LRKVHVLPAADKVAAPDGLCNPKLLLSSPAAAFPNHGIAAIIAILLTM